MLLGFVVSRCTSHKKANASGLVALHHDYVTTCWYSNVCMSAAVVVITTSVNCTIGESSLFLKSLCKRPLYPKAKAPSLWGKHITRHGSARDH